MTEHAALPTSNATNAYDLLSDVIRIIREEPKRYSQGDWLFHPDSGRIPACGTVGCVAGWVATLRPTSEPRVYHSAKATLGLDSFQACDLFAGDAVRFRAQTRLHAWSGARHIARFQQDHAEQLKAKAV